MADREGETGSPDEVFQDAAEPAGELRDLRASSLHFDGVDYLVVSFPLRRNSALGALTEAEAAVALLALRGLGNDEIAHVRSCSARTVANQLASVYRKLDVGSRVALAARLRERTEA